MDGRCISVDLNHGFADVLAWNRMFRVPISSLEFFRGRLGMWVSTLPNPPTGFEDLVILEKVKKPRSFLPGSPAYRMNPATVFAVQNAKMPGNFWRHGNHCGWTELGFATHWPSREYAEKRRGEICAEFRFKEGETRIIPLYVQVKA